MSENDDWHLATIRTDNGDVYARFDRAKRFVLQDEKYSYAIWFELESSETTELDECLRDMDEREDSIRAAMGECPDCHMLLALAEAGRREIVFASGGDPAVTETIRSILATDPERVAASVYEKPRFGPFAMLVQKTLRLEEEK